MSERLRVVVADDERPARSFLTSLLDRFDDVEIVGEAETGVEAVRVIESVRPDVALLDLQMPELDGLGVVHQVRPPALPLVIFVTAYDEYAVRAFELNAVDYLLKPVAEARLREALDRAHDRHARGDLRREAARVRDAAAVWDPAGRSGPLDRLPVRRGDEFLLVPVAEVASVIADGELLHVHTTHAGSFTITFRLKDLEARLDPALFVRLGRGTLANVGLIERIAPLPNGTYLVTMKTGQQLGVSRIQSRLVRDQLLKL